MPAWIAEADFNREVNTLRRRATDALEKAQERRVRNVVDPFQSLVVASTFDIQDRATLSDVQRADSAIRGLGNALGEFHQKILGSVDGWENHDAGYDLECDARMVLAEIKNKWNTMNSSNRRQVENDLEVALRQKRGDWTGYLVLVVPKSPHRYSKHLRGNLYETDGASFYHYVTGDANAIHDLLDELCDMLAPTDDIKEYCRDIMASSLPPRV